MSRPMDRERVRRLAWIMPAAGLVMLAAIGSAVLDGQRHGASERDGPVLGDWDRVRTSAQAIEIEDAAGAFRIERDAEGRWVMPSRDDHPVRRERVAALDAYLGGLVFEGARTVDPAKHARLRLAEPGGEGGGTRVTVRSGEGVLADLVLGLERDGRSYLRFAGELRTFAASVEEAGQARPSIAAPEDWLELDFLALGRTQIARTQIEPETGPAYLLERASQTTRNFALRAPTGWQPITAGAGNGPGAALARLRFRDVRRADRLNGERVASHTAETFEGLQVRLDILALGETRWASVTARALTDDAAEAADALNARTAGWAYLLSDLSLDRLARPLAEFADPRNAPDAP